jgi:broad specificity phosphatase PhoE
VCSTSRSGSCTRLEAALLIANAPRLREQDWGNLQDIEAIRRSTQERRAFGSFYYRFANGESGADVYDRVDSFWSAINREMKFHGCLENFVIVSHGITIRLLLMRYFKWTVDEFHLLWNFENCQMAVLQLQPDGKYSLMEPLQRNPVNGGHAHPHPHNWQAAKDC